jgi:hypothetical protein
MKAVLIAVLVFGVLAVLLGCSRWLARRHWAAAGNLLVAVLLFGGVFTFWPAVAHLATYQPMAREAPIAQVYCERTSPQSYRVTLTRLPDGQMQLFEIMGDEWRLDIRTLAWRERAASFGLRPQYRLDRLSARFTDSHVASSDSASPDGVRPVTAAFSARPSSYSLTDGNAAGADVWAQARTGVRWERIADARHAYGPWRPLVHGGRFDVWLSHQDGGDAVLEARPANEPAAQAAQARPEPKATTATR